MLLQDTDHRIHSVLYHVFLCFSLVMSFVPMAKVLVNQMNATEVYQQTKQCKNLGYLMIVYLFNQTVFCQMASFQRRVLYHKYAIDLHKSTIIILASAE